MWESLTRRQLFSLIGGTALAGTATPSLGRVDSTSGINQQTAVEKYSILEGTDQETTVYVQRATAEGPTVMVVGGIHGDETSGYRAANDVRSWSIDAGTLVVLPAANQVAIERRARYGEEGNLNRQFPAGEEPTTELARAIWDVVRRHDIDALIDLHQALGIYPGHPTGVEAQTGQAIFHSGGTAGTRSRAVAAYMNANVVPDSRPRYQFETAPLDSGLESTGMLATKAALDQGARSYLVQVTSRNLDLQTRVSWERRITRRLLVQEGLLEEGPTTPTPTEEPPQTEEPSQTEEPPTETETEEPPTETETEEPPTETETEEPSPTEEPPQTEEPSQTEEPPTQTEEPTPTPEENHAPTARIVTEPLNAENVDFDRGDTVTLNAAPSNDRDGEIVAYEWDTDDNGMFDRIGETVDVSLTACRSYPITLRVTDDDGATATEKITLSTIEPGQ